MAELVLRAGYNDHVVLAELLTDPAALTPRLARMIRRVVVDATAIAHQPAFAKATWDSGTQLLVDPQTAFLTSGQPADDSWAKLPFARPDAVVAGDLLNPTARRRLIEEVVEFELDHGGTAIIPPYLHLTELPSVASQVQRRLYKETSEYLQDLGLDFPIFPLVSVDQRVVTLEASSWPIGLGRLIRTARKYASGPIGLGLSMTTGPNQTNLHNATRIWRRVAKLSPFVAWHAGEVGLLAVTMGAEGYEAGMCTAERYNVRGQQQTRAAASAPGPRYTGAYVETLGRSLDRRVVEELSRIRGVHQADLGCLDPACCPHGFDSMLGNGRRQHSVRSRLRDLEALSVIGARGWRLHHLEARASAGVASAKRIRAAAATAGLRVGANPQELEAMYNVALNLQTTARVAGATA